MQRRDFLKSAGLSAGIAACPGVLATTAAADTPPTSKGSDRDTPKLRFVTDSTIGERQGDMLYRVLGQTGQRVSALGLGGHHIGRQVDANDSIKIIRTAVDRGITFLDNCWDYHDGASEIRMGKALKEGRNRDKIFLMTKIDGRTKESAAKQIDECLRRLDTDRVDLMQHHEIVRMEDPDRIFGEGGAQEAMLAAQKAGKIRYIGFTGHKDPLIHQRMLDIAREHNFSFDAVQMPLNVMDAHFRSFGQMVLPRLITEDIGVLGMKPMADGLILQSKTVTPQECLRYALSLPTSVVITGIDSLDVLEQDLKIMKEFKPLTEAEAATLLARTAEAAATGRYELFKTSNRFDGTARHPEWLG